MNAKFQELLKTGTNLLLNSGIQAARNETMILFEKALKKSKLELLTNPKINISTSQKRRILKVIYERREGKPISKIFGEKEFYSNQFKVNCNVLDPRPESELIVDIVKKLNKNSTQKTQQILDLGTGTGCLIISIILEHKEQKIFGLGVDICKKALKIANINISRYGLQERISLKKSSWFSNISGKFDIIISNPPYIQTSKIVKLQKEVKNYDPYISLNGGNDGLHAYRKIALDAKNFLNVNGIICLELGIDQLDSVNKIFNNFGYQTILEEKDLQDIHRVVVYKLK